MVCAACAKLQKPTSLATPAPKRKSEQYHLSLQSTSASRASVSNGISKNKLLGKGAKSPYAVYAASCEKCKTKVEQGKTYCQSCAYKANACAMCGKGLSKTIGGAAGGGIVVQGQRFSAK